MLMLTLNDYKKMIITFAKESDIDSSIIDFTINCIAKNDLAHHFDHIYEVMIQAMRYCSENNKDDHFTRCLIIAALFHDVGCYKDRKTHHEISCKLALFELMKVQKTMGLSTVDILNIGLAILQHRASYEGKVELELSRYLRAADRGNISLTEYIRRAYLFRINKVNPLLSNNKNIDVDEDQLVLEISKHFIEKFGIHGYAFRDFPLLAMAKYNQQVNEIMKFSSDDYTSTEKRVSFIKETIAINKENWLYTYK